MKKGKRSVASRRTLLKWGLCGLGVAALTTVPQKLITAQTERRIKTLTFNANDIGILNFALLLEELEAAFYALVVRSGKIKKPRELDYIKALAAHEATHVKFLRSVLGSKAIFQTEDIRFNQAGLNAVLKDRATILTTAVALEDTGVHAYNGAGPSLKNATYLLAAGSIVSVEARHAAGARLLLERPVTEEQGAVPNAELNPDLNPFKGRAYDELYTPKQIVEIVGSLNILNNPIEGDLVA